MRQKPRKYLFLETPCIRFIPPEADPELPLCALLVLLEGRQGGDCPEGRGAGGQGAKSRAQRGSSGSASGEMNPIVVNTSKTLN